MAIRVLLLTQWFDPEPTFKGIVFARELVRQGFEVEVVTGFPNYPGGKVYPGYRIKWLQREVIDGVQVTRLPLYPDHGQSAVKRVLNHASFAASALVYGLLFAKRPAVMYAYHPPLTAGVAAGLIRLLRRIPVVYDIQDMWPDTLRATGMLNNERALGIVASVCSWVYRRVDHIAVLSPGFKKLLMQRGVPEAKIDVIYNWADEASLGAPHGQLPAAFPTAEKFRILFAGNMGKAQALDTVLNAAVLLQQRGSRVCFVLLGGGVEVSRLVERAAELRLGNVVFLPPVPMAEVGILLEAADALLVHLRKDPLFEITIPSKTQAYMAAGKPLLMAVDGDAADLVRESGGGVIAASEEPRVLAASAEALAAMAPEALADMGAKARRHYREHLSLQIGVERFGALFKGLGAARTFDVKRVLDVFLAAAALLLLAVPLAFLTWQVSRKLGKPAFFRQVRPGRGGAVVRTAQVPHHDERARRQWEVVARCRAAHTIRPLPAFEQPRRAARTLECPPGRDEPGGATPVADGVPAAVHQRAGAPPRRAPRHHRLGAGQRPQCVELGRKIQARCLVCRQPHAVARHQDPVAHGAQGAHARWDLCGGRGDHAAFHRLCCRLARR